MYGGHIALGISAKRWAPIVPLWLLIVASQSLDWMDLAICGARSSTSSPAMLSHSIPAVAALAILGGVAGRFFYGNWQAAKILAVLIVSHLVTDYVTGNKPTWPGGPPIGLGLYSRPLLDFILESLVILWGWWVYRSTFRPAQRNSFAVRAMLLGLIALQAIADIALAIVPRISKCG